MLFMKYEFYEMAIKLLGARCGGPKPERHARMSEDEKRGMMGNPLGDATLSGSYTAARTSPQVLHRAQW